MHGKDKTEKQRKQMDEDVEKKLCANQNKRNKSINSSENIMAIEWALYYVWFTGNDYQYEVKKKKKSTFN